MAKCSICNHPKRKEIDRALVDPRANIRGLARVFAVSEFALTRHIKNGHIVDKIKKIQNAQDAAEALDFIAHIQKRRARFEQIAKEAAEEGDFRKECGVYQIEPRYLELEGKALGAFQPEKKEIAGTIMIHFDKQDESV